MNEAILTVASLLLASYGALWWRVGRVEQVHKNLNMHLETQGKEIERLTSVIENLQKTVDKFISGR